MADDADARDYVDKCINCQLNKKNRHLPAADMFSFDATALFDLVVIDILGPLAESISHKKFVVLIVDCFSRYVDAEALEDIQGKTCVDYIKGYIGRFGIPRALLSNNAASFVNRDMKELVTRFKF